MSDNKEIKAGIGYTFGNIFIKGASFLSLPIFTRLLTTEQYGIFNTYLAYESIITVLLGLGIYASIKNAKYDFPGKMDLFFSSLLRISLCSLTVGAILLVILGKFFSECISLSIPILVILLFQSNGTVLLGLFNAKVSLEYDYKTYLLASCFNTLTNIGVSVLLIETAFRNEPEIGRILGSAIPLIILSIYIFISEGKKAKFKADKEMILYALGIGIPLIWHLLSQTIQSQIDRIMITEYVNSSATGIYSFIYSIAVIYQVIYNSTDTVWSVWFYERLDGAEHQKIKDVLPKYLMLLTFVGISMMVISRELIMVMADKEYWSGVTLFQPVLIGLFFLFLYTILAAVEYYYKKTEFIAIGTTIAAAVNIITNYIFIPRFGYYAAAFTTLFSYFVTFIIHYFIIKKLLKDQNLIGLFSIKQFLPSIGMMGGAGVFTALFSDKWLIKYTVYIIFLIILGCIYKNEIAGLIKCLITKRKK